MARGPSSGVVHSNRLLGACGANLLRGESERPGGKGDDGDNAFAGESGGLRAAGILGDDLEETGAGGARGGSEGDIDEASSFGGDAAPAGVGLGEIAGDSDGTSCEGMGAVIGDGGRERGARSADNLVGEE